MPPLPADNRPFVARARPDIAVGSASASLPAPFVAAAREGAAIRGARATETPASRHAKLDAAEADLPWLSESVEALAGPGESGEELLSPPAKQAPEATSTDADEPMEPWDDELGTIALSEELPESIGELVTGPSSVEVELVPDESEWPNYTLPIVTSHVPSAALEGVAQRLEQIARTLRERGPTGPLEENSSDPLSALITGYVLGISGAAKGGE